MQYSMVMTDVYGRIDWLLQIHLSREPWSIRWSTAKVLPAQARLQHDKTVTVALEDLKLVAKEMKELGLSPERLLGKHVDL